MLREVLVGQVWEIAFRLQKANIVSCPITLRCSTSGPSDFTLSSAARVGRQSRTSSSHTHKSIKISFERIYGAILVLGASGNAEKIDSHNLFSSFVQGQTILAGWIAYDYLCLLDAAHCLKPARSLVSIDNVSAGTAALADRALPTPHQAPTADTIVHRRMEPVEFSLDNEHKDSGAGVMFGAAGSQGHMTAC